MQLATLLQNSQARRLNGRDSVNALQSDIIHSSELRVFDGVQLEGTVIPML